MKLLLIPIALFLISPQITGQEKKIDSIKINTPKKEVPKAIEELVKQFDKQTKEAQKKHRQQIVIPPTLEINGIIMDETMSKSGRDFYELFFSNWKKPKEFSNYYIKIKERPFRMNSTLIEVYLKETLVYQAVLKRRYDDIVDMAKTANLQILKHIEYIKEAQKALNKTSHLGNDI